MRHISADEFTASAAELTAALNAGDEVVVTLGGTEYQLVPRARSVCDQRTPEQRQRQREAVDAAWALGQEILRTRGPTTSAEIRAWIEEDHP